MSTPIRRIWSGCCARAASGHAAIAPPIAVTNSRRLIETSVGPFHVRASKRTERYHAAHLSSCHLGAECGACAVVMARASRHERAMHHGLRDTSAESEPMFGGWAEGLRAREFSFR